ncbi:MAG: HTTM domain-containing protein [Actinomycetota bacterium]
MKAKGSPWDAFWFSPTSVATLTVLRIAFGVIMFFWAVAIAPDAINFFSSDGVLPAHPTAGPRWGLLALFHSDIAIVAVTVLLLVSAACLAAGYRTRLAAVCAWVALMSFTRRDPFIFNSGDAVLRNFALFLALAPAGEALSLDRWRADRAGLWRFPERAPWALRLFQIQVSTVYLFTVWAKARGERWFAGTAVSESLRVDDLLRLRLPDSLTDSVLLANLLTFGTLAVELSLAILIWNRRWRPYVIVAGIALHFFIEVTFALGFFSMVMIASYISFVPEDAMERFLGRVRTRMRGSRLGFLRRIAEAGDPGAPAVQHPAPVTL